MNKKDLLKVVACLAWEVHHHAISAAVHSLDADKLVHRIEHPRRGDLVVEISTTYLFPAWKRVGIFRGTHYHKDVRIWNIESLITGKVTRWDNCKFITVFQDKKQK